MREILPKRVEYVPREQQLADMAAREEKTFRDGQRQRRLQVSTRRCRFTNVRFRGKSGHDLFALQMSAFDPKRTSGGPLTSLIWTATMRCTERRGRQ